MKAREKFYCKSIGAAIRKLRQKTNKSVRLFAYENDIPQVTLSRIERGDNEPKLIVIKKIAEGLDLPFHEHIKQIEEILPKNFKIFEDEHH